LGDRLGTFGGGNKFGGDSNFSNLLSMIGNFWRGNCCWESGDEEAEAVEELVEKSQEPAEVDKNGVGGIKRAGDG
jgi:hypothetical protein